MSHEESLALVLIAALSLVVVFVLLKIFARARAGRIDGVRVEKRQVGTSWVVSLESRDLPRGLFVGRPPTPEPHDLVPLRAGLGAWGLSARRRFKEGAPLTTAWAGADGEWTLTDGVMKSWLRSSRGPTVSRQVDARVAEGLALIRLLRSNEPPTG
jgi:hypothetical protein